MRYFALRWERLARAGQRAPRAIPWECPPSVPPPPFTPPPRPVLLKKRFQQPALSQAAQTLKGEATTQIGVLIISPAIRLQLGHSSCCTHCLFIILIYILQQEGGSSLLTTTMPVSLSGICLLRGRNLTFTQENTLLHKICVITECIPFKIRECLSKEDYKGRAE